MYFRPRNAKSGVEPETGDLLTIQGLNKSVRQLYREFVLREGEYDEKRAPFDEKPDIDNPNELAVFGLDLDEFHAIRERNQEVLLPEIDKAKAAAKQAELDKAIAEREAAMLASKPSEQPEP